MRAILLAMALVFGLVCGGCGDKEGDKPKVPGSAQEKVEDTKDKAEEGAGKLEGTADDLLEDVKDSLDD